MITNPVNGYNQNERKDKVNSFFKEMGSVYVGNHVAQLAVVPLIVLSPILSKKIQEQSQGLTQDEFVEIENGAKKVMEDSGMAKKGGEIIKASLFSFDDIKKVISEEYEKHFITKHYSPAKKEALVNKDINKYFQGVNAACYPIVKKIIMPEQKLALAVFHEMGHLCSSFSKIGNLNRNLRVLQFAAAPIGFIGLWKNKKAPGQEPGGKIDKTTDFIKNNAGKLTFLTFLPLLAEEGFASIKAHGFAKKVLNPSLLKKVNTTNKFGFLTYLLRAVSVSAGIAVAIKVKDKVNNTNPTGYNR